MLPLSGAGGGRWHSENKYALLRMYRKCISLRQNQMNTLKDFVPIKNRRNELFYELDEDQTKRQSCQCSGAEQNRLYEGHG
jgi:hypothetical protein